MSLFWTAFWVQVLGYVAVRVGGLWYEAADELQQEDQWRPPSV